MKSKTAAKCRGMVYQKIFLSQESDKEIFYIAFSCGRRGTAIAVDEELN